jgi:NAD(P)-dependent dehydrogenase (short-subunit alcohol dehydrogenase family)
MLVIHRFNLSPHALADIEKWEDLFAVNIRGPILCYKYGAKQMVKQGDGGRIIGENIGSNIYFELTVPHYSRRIVNMWPER